MKKIKNTQEQEPDITHDIVVRNDYIPSPQELQRCSPTIRQFGLCTSQLGIQVTE